MAFIDQKNWANVRKINKKANKIKAINQIPGRPFSSNVAARYSAKTYGRNVLNPFLSFPFR
jgi:hypothetical protein